MNIPTAILDETISRVLGELGHRHRLDETQANTIATMLGENPTLRRMVVAAMAERQATSILECLLDMANRRIAAV
jgi:hypothetical protein